MGGYMATAKKVEWNTPSTLKNKLIEEFGVFDLDPATSNQNPMEAESFYTEREDGLTQKWNGSNVYVNPPYGRILNRWVSKAIMEFECGRSKRIVMLLPSRTCTRWFHWIYERGFEIRFIKGRLKYNDGKTPAPFPSIIVIIE